MNKERGMQQRPKISVCIATYNGERFIGKQLETILPELLPGDEVIVSDDSSIDRSLEIIESFGDSRIHVYKDQKFRSATYNFENALKHAKGDVIILADQDDEWLPGRINRVMEALLVDSLVVCDADVIDADGNLPREGPTKIYSGVRRPGVLQNLYRNGYIGCCCAFRREVLDAALPFPKNLPWHDWWIGLVADAFFTTIFLPDKLVRYRKHGGNASPTGERSPYSFSRKFMMRWQITTSLIGRRISRSLRV